MVLDHYHVLTHHQIHLRVLNHLVYLNKVEVLLLILLLHHLLMI
tara:strand:- start:159 stop:290 length:132 start_codon:yes stop_codon:yes gene_type:complete